VWRVTRRGKWTAAGIALGILVSIKPFLAMLVLVFLSRRQWLATAVTSLTALLCFLVGTVALGWAAALSWWNAVMAVSWAGHIFNASIFGFF
jgi:hypothetical protein